jgi:hypothetical protein
MAVLADCAVYYWRELLLKMEYHNVTPPWERDVANGGNYQWAPTQFKFALHKTADPGEAGNLTTNTADYGGYATIVYGRGTTYWEMVSAGTANPLMRTKGALYWPMNSGAAQTIICVSYAMIDSGIDYPVARDASISLSIPTNRVPNIAANGFTVKAR